MNVRAGQDKRNVLCLYEHNEVFCASFYIYHMLTDGSAGKESACNAVHEMWVQSLGWEDAPEEEMVTHLSILD